jgi:hypothetical protein
LYYHFCGINNRSLKNLVGGRIYLSKPDDLNDPFDCKLFPQLVYKDEQAKAKARSMELLIDSSKKTRNDFADLLLDDFNQAIFKTQESLGENFYYRTFSLVGENNKDGQHAKENQLMWAHYANAHKGMCLGFDFSDADGLCKVNYLDKHDPIEVQEKDIDKERCIVERGRWLSKDLEREIEKRAFISKSRAWEYENEYRFIDS